jgi:MYXO-CTERM domain-containing protein
MNPDLLMAGRYGPQPKAGPPSWWLVLLVLALLVLVIARGELGGGW